MLFFGPFLAQAVTVSVADRTEARYVAINDRHYEAATIPSAATEVAWRQVSLTARYSPSLTVLPLESSDRDLLVLHNGYIGVNYKWQRSQLIFSEQALYGDQNFYILALTSVPTVSPNNGPAPNSSSGTAQPPAGTTPGMGGIKTPTGTPTQPIRAASNESIRFLSSITTATFQNNPSTTTQLRAELSYLVSGATESKNQVNYPVMQGPRAQASAQYAVGRRDAFASTLIVQYQFGQLNTVYQNTGAITGHNDVSAWISNYAETWVHVFGRHTTSQLGVGVSGTRSPADNGFIKYSIYPTFLAGITGYTELNRGMLTASFTTSAAPAIDLVTAAVDPRLSAIGILGWRRDKFFSTLSTDATISLQSQSKLGALSMVGGGMGLGYQFTRGMSADAGARVAYQRFEGQTVLPFSQVIFVGLRFWLDHRY